MRRGTLMIAAVAVAVAAVGGSQAASVSARRAEPIRFATFNASLNRPTAGALRAELRAAVDDDGVVGAQLSAVLEITRINDPDVLLVNEFDSDGDTEAASLFAELADYPYFFTAPSNTGIPSGFDLDNSGSVGGPNDAFGFGFFPGNFGMAVFSKYPIEEGAIRTFQQFLWKDMPGARLPKNPDRSSWYSPEELDVFRLSSKSHWDVPIHVGRRKVVHFLVSHPTPPVFDGPEDRNGTRNFDEIRFWADYIRPAESEYVYDDAGTFGGLRRGASFVIAGDQNSDPLDGDSIPGAIQQLLDNPRVNDRLTPRSDGGVEAAALQGGANLLHRSDPAEDTADFSDNAPGNLRADYVLPSKNLRIVRSAVFWPTSTDPNYPLTGDGSFPAPSSDHRLVWVDVRVPGT